MLDNNSVKVDSLRVPIASTQQDVNVKEGELHGRHITPDCKASATEKTAMLGEGKLISDSPSLPGPKKGILKATKSSSREASFSLTFRDDAKKMDHGPSMSLIKARHTPRFDNSALTPQDLKNLHSKAKEELQKDGILCTKENLTNKMHQLSSKTETFSEHELLDLYLTDTPANDHPEDTARRKKISLESKFDSSSPGKEPILLRENDPKVPWTGEKVLEGDKAIKEKYEKLEISDHKEVEDSFKKGLIRNKDEALKTLKNQRNSECLNERYANLEINGLNSGKTDIKDHFLNKLVSQRYSVKSFIDRNNPDDLEVKVQKNSEGDYTLSYPGERKKVFEEYTEKLGSSYFLEDEVTNTLETPLDLADEGFKKEKMENWEHVKGMVKNIIDEYNGKGKSVPQDVLGSINQMCKNLRENYNFPHNSADEIEDLSNFREIEQKLHYNLNDANSVKNAKTEFWKNLFIKRKDFWME